MNSKENGQILRKVTRKIIFTFVSMLTPAFEDAYATAPLRFPRFKPEVEEILIIDPFRWTSHMRLHTYFETNQQPVKLVLKT
jgi:hypothetical protein